MEGEFGRARGYIARSLLPTVAKAEQGSRPLAHTRLCEAYKLTPEILGFLAAPGKFDVEQLVKDVLAAYGAYDAKKLEEMWKYKGYVMSVVARDGGNTYDPHRKRARSG